jgi:hypothetical protein
LPEERQGPEPGEKYPNDPLTDQVSNVIYQLIKTGSVAGVPWQLGKNFWNLDPCFLDRVGAPLAKSAIENGIKLDAQPAEAAPKLHSQLKVDRYANGHVAHYPCGMPAATDPSIWAWADYDTGCMSLSANGQPPPPRSRSRSRRPSWTRRCLVSRCPSRLAGHVRRLTGPARRVARPALRVAGHAR